MKLYLLMLILILPACSTLAASTPTQSSAATPWDETFAQTIYQRLALDDTIPTSGRQATLSLIAGQPTALFPDNQGLVLIFEVPAVPPSQAETTRAAVLLIGTAVSVAKEQAVPLVGVEIIFYAHSEPFMGFRAVPPWSADDIQAAPLNEALRQKIEEKGGPSTPRPTASLSGG